MLRLTPSPRPSLRKATLIATLALMGIATFLIAVVPTYASIGIWGGVILTISRAIQGIGIGGEWVARCCCRWNGRASLRSSRSSRARFVSPLCCAWVSRHRLYLYRLRFRLRRRHAAYVPNFILAAVTIASCVLFISIPLFGHISDLIGRKNMYLVGAAICGLFGFLYFEMLDTAIPTMVFAAIVVSLIPHDMMYGPQAALIAEAFTPPLRYSGASLDYQFVSVIAGGPAPLIATALFATHHSSGAIAAYLAICCVISLASGGVHA